jgi:hypothetical protein
MLFPASTKERNRAIGELKALDKKHAASFGTNSSGLPPDVEVNIGWLP